MVLGGFVGGFGWFWVVLGRFGSFWVVPCFSNYALRCHTMRIENNLNRHATYIHNLYLNSVIL